MSALLFLRSYTPACAKPHVGCWAFVESVVFIHYVFGLYCNSNHFRIFLLTHFFFGLHNIFRLYFIFGLHYISGRLSSASLSDCNSFSDCTITQIMLYYSVVSVCFPLVITL